MDIKNLKKLKECTKGYKNKQIIINIKVVNKLYM